MYISFLDFQYNVAAISENTRIRCEQKGGRILMISRYLPGKGSALCAYIYLVLKHGSHTFSHGTRVLNRSSKII